MSLGSLHHHESLRPAAMASGSSPPLSTHHEALGLDLWCRRTQISDYACN